MPDHKRKVLDAGQIRTGSAFLPGNEANADIALGWSRFQQTGDVVWLAEAIERTGLSGNHEAAKYVSRTLREQSQRDPQKGARDLNDAWLVKAERKLRDDPAWRAEAILEANKVLEANGHDLLTEKDLKSASQRIKLAQVLCGLFDFSNPDADGAAELKKMTARARRRIPKTSNCK